jgi:hypothetical protein
LQQDTLQHVHAERQREEEKRAREKAAHPPFQKVLTVLKMLTMSIYLAGVNSCQMKNERFDPERSS